MVVLISRLLKYKRNMYTSKCFTLRPDTDTTWYSLTFPLSFLLQLRDRIDRDIDEDKRQMMVLPAAQEAPQIVILAGHASVDIASSRTEVTTCSTSAEGGAEGGALTTVTAMAKPGVVWRNNNNNNNNNSSSSNNNDSGNTGRARRQGGSSSGGTPTCESGNTSVQRYYYEAVQLTDGPVGIGWVDAEGAALIAHSSEHSTSSNGLTGGGGEGGSAAGGVPYVLGDCPHSWVYETHSRTRRCDDPTHRAGLDVRPNAAMSAVATVTSTAAADTAVADTAVAAGTDAVRDDTAADDTATAPAGMTDAYDSDGTTGGVAGDVIGCWLQLEAVDAAMEEAVDGAAVTAETEAEVVDTVVDTVRVTMSFHRNGKIE